MEKLVDDLCNWIQDFYKNFDPDKKAVIGISGGKDSTVAAAVLCKALGKDRVIGVSLPNGSQLDMDYVDLVFETLGIKRVDINIETSVYSILSALQENGIFATSQTKQNLPARIRMSALYAVGQSVNGLVVNTCNLSEDWVGYSTRYGDSVGDFSLFQSLLSDDVIAIGKYLDLPEKLLLKSPSDGLCGKTDEDNLGFSYAVLNKYIRIREIEQRSGCAFPFYNLV